MLVVVHFGRSAWNGGGWSVGGDGRSRSVIVVFSLSGTRLPTTTSTPSFRVAVVFGSVFGGGLPLSRVLVRFGLGVPAPPPHDYRCCSPSGVLAQVQLPLRFVSLPR